MSKETQDIASAIQLLERGPWRERREYEKALAEGKKIFLNGYNFERDCTVWYVWKPTDIDKNPEYKGEPLLKIVPLHNVRDYEALLNAQSWLYI